MPSKSKNNDVIFRRVNGRIVPIRLTKAHKEQAKGAGIIAAGAAVAAGGGKVYSHVVTKSATKAFKGFSALEGVLKKSGPAQLSFFDMNRMSAARKAANASLKAGQTLAKLSKTIRLGSTAIGAGIIGYGASKVANNMTKAQKKKISPELLAGGSAAAAAIAPMAWHAASKSFTAGGANRQTAMKFAAQSWTEHSPKVTKAIKAFLKIK